MNETTSEPIQIAFICVQNAGRSQMATAFAKHERTERDLTASVEILTGGTQPADRVHQVVVEVMAENGIDLSDRTPREITSEELASCDYIVTMGCSTLEVGEADLTGTIHDWALTDPDGRDLDAVRTIRDDIQRQVAGLFDEIGTD